MRTIILALLALATMLPTVSACGHSRNALTTQPSVTNSATMASSAGQAEWLTEALAELDSLQRPSDVNPQIFVSLKTRLAQLLRDKVSGKLASSISSVYTSALDLRFTQDSAESDVYLTWGYANRGDYDQSGTVGVSDITPLAQQLTNSWYEGVWDPELTKSASYREIAAVVDGDLDGSVDYEPPDPPDPGNPGDLELIAQNFGNTVANYTIYGSDDPDDEEPSEIDTIAFTAYVNGAPAGAPPKRLFYRFNLTEQELEDPYAYYWVRPDDGGTPLYGAYSDSYWEGPSDNTPDPADLRPVVGAVKPANHVFGQRGTDVTFSYNLSADGTMPTEAREWDFGGASSG